MLRNLWLACWLPVPGRRGGQLRGWPARLAAGRPASQHIAIGCLLLLLLLLLPLPLPLPLLWQWHLAAPCLDGLHISGLPRLLGLTPAYSSWPGRRLWLVGSGWGTCARPVLRARRACLPGRRRR